MKIGDRVFYKGEDINNAIHDWYGVIVGEGPEGITVEFEGNFDGHGGFSKDNNLNEYVCKNSTCWFFDFPEFKTHEEVPLTTDLTILEEPN